MPVIDAALVERWIQDPPAITLGFATVPITAEADMAAAVFADCGHRLRLGENLHGFRDGFHAFDRHQHSNGTALFGNSYGVIRRLLHNSGKPLL